MDDDVIEALADAFASQLEYIRNSPRLRGFETATLDIIVGVAVVIHDFEPTYDLRYFYKRAGCPEPYPVHEM